MTLERITINGVTVRNDPDTETVYIEGASLHYDTLPSMFEALGLMGFDLDGYTTSETRLAMGREANDD